MNDICVSTLRWRRLKMLRGLKVNDVLEYAYTGAAGVRGERTHVFEMID